MQKPGQHKFNMGGKIKIKQWNAQRCQSATDSVVNTDKSDIILLQEPYTGNTGQLKTKRWQVYQSTKGTRESPNKTAILVNNSIKATMISSITSENSTYIEIETRVGTITLGSVYVEPKNPLAPQILTITKLNEENRKKGKSILIGGDFNAKSSWWGSPKTDKRGEELAETIATLDAHILNDGSTPTFETWRSGNHLTSFIDVTFCSNNIMDKVTNWGVEQTGLSDHNVITMSISDKIMPPESTTPRYRTKLADWTKFEKVAKEMLQKANITIEDPVYSSNPINLEKQVETISSIIKTSCERSIPKPGGKRKNCPWWSDSLTLLKSELVSAKRKLQNSCGQRRSEVTLPKYLEAKENFKNELRESKTSSWKDFCQKQTKESTWSNIYRVLTNPPNRAPTSTFKSDNPEETAKEILHHFFPDDNAINETPEQMEIRIKAMQETTVDQEPHISKDELQNALRSMDPKKCPGADGITSDILTRFHDSFPEILTKMFQKCFNIGYFPKIWKEANIIIIPKPGKDNYSSLENYRPIGLLPVLGKLFEKILIDRIKWNLGKGNKLSSKQYGFTSQKSAEDAMYDAVEVIKGKMNKTGEVIVISLDIKGAFDNAWWPQLLKQLIEKECPSSLVTLVRSYTEDRKVRIRHGNSSSEKCVSKGCIQGSIGGPTFWNVSLDELLQMDLGPDVYIQAYADDVLLIVNGKNLQIAKETAEKALEKVSNWGKKVKLEFSEKKTQIMVMSKSREKTINVNMNGKEIKPVKEIKILGMIIDNKLRWDKHIDYICSKTTTIFKALCRAAKPTWGLSPEIIKTIYDGAIVPIFTYGSGVWGDTCKRVKNRKKLASIQRQYAIRICKGYKTISTTSALALAGTPPIDLKIAEIKEIYRINRRGVPANFLPADREIMTTCNINVLPHPGKIVRENIKIELENGNKINEDPIQIYTDGSKQDGKVGAGLVIKEAGKDWVSKSYKLEDYCTVYQAEMLAIQKAIEWVQTKGIIDKDITINSDSKSSLETLRDARTTNDIARECLKKLETCRKNKNRVKFQWVRAHRGLEGNEKADEAAKKGRLLKKCPDYSKVPTSFTKITLKRETEHKWDIRYMGESTGKITKKYFPNINTALIKGKHVENSFHATQMLTGHGCFKEYLKRFKIIDDDKCPCDKTSTQDSTHVLEKCSIFDIDRFRLNYKLKNFGITDENRTEIWKQKKTSEIYIAFLEKITKGIKEINEKNEN